MKRSLAALALALAAALPAAAAAQAGSTQLTWYGHAAFTVRTPQGTVLAIDPWLSNPAAKDKQAAQKLGRVDFILITHGHADHVGDAVAIAKRTGAKLVGSIELAQALLRAGYPMDPQGFKATAGNIGGSIPLTDEVTVTLVQAVHSSGFQKDDQSPVEYAGNPVGFVIQIRGGPTIYHTGDTAPFGDMELLSRRWPVDVMLACIGGHFTMDPAGAALAASLVRPKVIVPMHFGTFPLLKGTPAELANAIQARGVTAKVLEMKVGETRSF